MDSAGKVKAIVKEGSILEKHLQPNYLADVKTEVAKAEASKTAAALSETLATESASKSESYAVGGTGTRDNENTDNAKYYSEQAKAIRDSVPTYLSQIDAAADEAIAKVNDALSSSTPTFQIDLTTGHLMYTGNRFNFQVNQDNGHLQWEVV